MRQGVVLSEGGHLYPCSTAERPEVTPHTHGPGTFDQSVRVREITVPINNAEESRYPNSKE